MQAHIKSRTQDVKVMGTNGMDGCEIEAQCSNRSTMFDRRYLMPSLNASIIIDVIGHRNNMYADDPTSLVDSTQKLLLFCEQHRLVI